MRAMVLVLLIGCGGAVDPAPDAAPSAPAALAPVPCCQYVTNVQTGGLIGWRTCGGDLVTYDGGTVPACAAPAACAEIYQPAIGLCLNSCTQVVGECPPKG